MITDLRMDIEEEGLYWFDVLVDGQSLPGCLCELCMHPMRFNSA